MAQTLNSMTFPLHGARLIEASAGTGKTFTIAALYLRLLLGHGRDGAAHQQPLTVDQILVVTFTEAATAELRGRIRRRIHEARIAFAQGETNDPVLAPLLANVIAKSGQRELAIETLLQAERQMDEAAIFTIHGFCQRMLTQNAFESGSRFQNEFITDESQIKLQVVSDYWRRHFYPLPKSLAAQIQTIWSSPHSLLSEIGNYLSGPELSFPAMKLDVDLVELQQQHLQRLEKVKTLWNESRHDMFSLIDGSGIKRNPYNKTRLPAWLDEVHQWAQMPTTDGQISDKLIRFAQSTLNTATDTKKGDVAQHKAFVAIDELLDNQPNFELIFKYQAIRGCRQLLALAKEQQGQLSFDDLLSQLERAINSDKDGLLTERIRQLYPVAMIDEFQDTDPQQYQIFRNIYLNHADNGWFMIGDPKQAIYGFRGADIFTYIQARNEVNDHYTLGTNWRSSSAMIDGVNQIFSFAERPFLYDEDIPFLPVNASDNADNMHWLLEGEAQSAIQFWLHEDDTHLPVSSGDYNQAMASHTAHQIHRILSASQSNQAVFIDKKGREKAIQASDIAVLVRTGREGKQIKQALAKQGIASVYLSNRDSVFGSDVASDVLRLLVAASNPSDEGALRAILASDVFALNAQELDRFNTDENAWENVVNEFESYHALWLQRGVLPMIRAVISQRHIAERWLMEINGERKLTDLLHLSELIQQASLTLEGENALIRWLGENIEQPDGEIGDQTQRLESERNLVQIITIHKSKGLEYDLVFLPFTSNFRAAKVAKYYQEDKKQTVLDLSKPDEGLSLAEKERLAEDLRLLYVALTRAVYGCFIGIAPLKKGNSKKDESTAHLSALGCLLQNHQASPASGLKAGCESLLKKASSMLIAAEPAIPSQPYVPSVEQKLSLKALELKAAIDRSWRMTSYSSLIKQSHQPHGHQVFDVAVDVESNIDSDAQDDNAVSSASSIAMEVGSDVLGDEMTGSEMLEAKNVDPWNMFEFPRGARPGTFLHTIFEEIEFTQAATSSSNTEVITQLLEKEKYDLQWLPAIQNMVDQVLKTPLDSHDLRLGTKGPKQRLVEMEFLLPVTSLMASSLNKLIKTHDELSSVAGDLDFYSVKGMLKGFIDLVFEHQGKYYVLDWKSNHLGSNVEDYHLDNIKQAMVDHRYDFQYQIYALALHRFLQSRIADYDYQKHFGGVYYLFLRGFSSQEAQGFESDEPENSHAQYGIFSAKPSQSFLQDFDRLLDGERV
ncbi:exodeoxyribonuclease V subunit beta [Vibrio rumoiensis]|uniref:RecBCD enzyme subunit RecB n=1 Tax=Vibrio rumoiensis 1S-45 TaxID=1188252 RepID=A0A1E5E2U5_9VIBR|nr:exodeoxyribonuclease V subunit beta [Vibrio rumoiensis]OEF25874.1 exodeoxyribonuclease V subunit beta [Vibrio rumoiensis 1S-45]